MGAVAVCSARSGCLRRGVVRGDGKGSPGHAGVGLGWQTGKLTFTHGPAALISYSSAPHGSGTTAGGARTTHARGGLRPEEDWGAHLLTLRPLLASSIDSSLPHPPIRNRFGWERFAQRLRLEAYPSLPARSDRCTPDCVRAGKATLGVRVYGGGAHERKGRRGKRLRTKPEAQRERALCLSIDLKTLPPCNAPVSLSRVTQRTAKHMRQLCSYAAAGTHSCANGCGLHEGSPTSPLHTQHSAPQWGLNKQLTSTYELRTALGLLALRTLHAQSTINCTIPEKQV